MAGDAGRYCPICNFDGICVSWPWGVGHEPKKASLDVCLLVLASLPCLHPCLPPHFLETVLTTVLATVLASTVLGSGDPWLHQSPCAEASLSVRHIAGHFEGRAGGHVSVILLQS